MGSDDTYGAQGQTGGASSGTAGEYGMGSGRTEQQETPSSGYHSGGGTGNKSSESSDSKKDSTSGKLMEKMGGMFKNEKMQESGAEKRRQAGYGEGDDY